MIPLVRIDEQTFPNLSALSDHLASTKRSYLEAPVRGISVGEDGRFHAGNVEGALSEPAMRGLTRLVKLPENFARAMPPDLFSYTVGRLARDRQDMLRVHTQNDVVNAIMPANYLPVRDQLISEWLTNQGIQAHAVLSPTYLRITTVIGEAKAALPGDDYRQGWELINYENGLGPLEVRQYLLRLVCLNGVVAFTRAAGFTRLPAGPMPISEALQKVDALVRDVPALPEIEKGVRWATERPIGNQLKPIMNFLANRIEGETTRLGLSGIGEDSSWHDIFNGLTSFAQTRPSETRRRYEVFGGILLDWFMRQGRGRAPWRRQACAHCTQADERSN